MTRGTRVLGAEDREAALRRSQLRWFGLILAAVFGVIGGVVGWRLGSWSAAQPLWAIGVGLAALYYLVRPLRIPMYLTWMAVFAPIGALISRILLGIVYWGVITPVALVMRPFRRDRLTRSFEPDAVSYWSAHDPGGDTERYFRQS